MGSSRRFGFSRSELSPRYNVASIEEDEWHSFEDGRRRSFLRTELAAARGSSRYLLNAGAGVHVLEMASWHVVSADLFSKPLTNHCMGVCTSITKLPFLGGTFGAIVCLGEVLGYCDPSDALEEFSRVLVPGGALIFDFESTRSSRYWFSSTYDRAADMVTVEYNGAPEKLWIYSPKYVESLLTRFGFSISQKNGLCGWAALLQRIGIKTSSALSLSMRFEKFSAIRRWSDLIIVSALRL
jgi:SAM-dependent methyltransferase